jgi:O-antigen/teichoic acid export membrane protein
MQRFNKKMRHGDRLLSLNNIYEKSETGHGSGRRLFKMLGWQMAPKILGAVLSIIYLALVARSLGPSNFGRFAIMFGFIQTIAGIASFQTWQLILRYGTGPALQADKGTIGKLALLSIWLDIAGTIIGMVMVGLAVAPFGGRFDWTMTETLTVIGLTFALLVANRSTPSGLLRVHGFFSDNAYCEMIVPILRMIGVVLLVELRPGIIGFLVVWVLSEFVCTLVTWIWTFKRTHLKLAEPSIPNRREFAAAFPGWLQFAAGVSASSTLRLLNQNFLVVIVGLVGGNNQAGFFRLGHQIGQAFARITDSISLAVFTEYARIRHIEQPDNASRLIGRTLMLGGISAAILLSLTFLFGQGLIVAIFGAKFAPAFPYLLLLGVAAAVNIAPMAFEPALMAEGRAGRAFLANLFGAVFMLGLLLPLSAYYGAYGVAIAALGGAIATAGAFTFAYVTRPALLHA